MRSLHNLLFRYQKYGIKLKELKEERKKVLEEVIETESFKNAKELLERFGQRINIKSLLELLWSRSK